MKRSVYIASKTKHAQKWIELRHYGFNIISTWIDEAGADESTGMEDLCRRCIEESLKCDAMIVYAEPGDILKGAFIEMGVALTVKGKPIFIVGEPLQSGSVFTHHPTVFKANSVEHALDIINNKYEWDSGLRNLATYFMNNGQAQGEKQTIEETIKWIRRIAEGEGGE